MLSKRETLLLGGSALLSTSFGVVAQQNANVSASIDAFRAALPFAFDTEARLAPTPDAIALFLETEADARRALFRDLNVLPEAEVFASFVPEIVEHVGLQISELSLVVPLATAVEQLKGEEQAAIRPDDSVNQVVFDIVVDTFALEVFRPALNDLAVGDTEFGRLYRLLLERLEIRDFDGATEALINLLLFVLSGPGLTLLQQTAENRMSRREVRNALLRALGSRAVPVVGWAFTGAAFAACLFHHGPRLRAAFDAN